MRDHQPQPIDTFNGLFARGDIENTPVDHFQGSNNIRHIGKSVFTRDGITISQDVNAVTPLTNIRRIYNYPTITKNTQIVLSYDPNTDTGHIYHVVDKATQFGPVLSIVGMTDFAFVPFGGRAYISPFASLPPAFPAPATSPSGVPHSGSGIDTGSHDYAVTFYDGTDETTPSPILAASAHDAISDPTVTPVPLFFPYNPTNSNNLVTGGTYHFKFTYSIDNNFTETAVGPIATLTSSNLGLTGWKVGMSFDSSFPTTAGLKINIYRTVNGGSTYYREVALLDPSAFGPTPNVLSTQITVGVITDAALVNLPQAPAANNTAVHQITLNNIPVAVNQAGVTITKRRIYRSAANATQLKLLTTINDNSTTTYLDSTADASLGANAPTENTFVLQGDNIEKGLQGEFLYVYAGDGTNARKAAGAAIDGTMTVAAGSGLTDAGVHVYGVVSETVSGYLTPPGALTTFTNTGQGVSFGNIPTSGDPNVVARHIVASKAITNFNGNLQGYQLYFIPGADINNNTDTFLNNVSFFDQDLLEDAQHLFDNYSAIPAGSFLTLYHGRLVLGCTYDDINLVLVSTSGEPEAISQISGLLSTQPNGFPVSNAAEFRDVLYVFRPNSTMSFTDNNDDPTSWPLVELEGALGARVHAVAQYLNSQTQSVDSLIIATYQGVSLFTGGYQVPELSWKIEDYWKSFDRTIFGFVQVIVNTVKKRIYVIMPDRSLLVGFIQNGTDPSSIQWEPWTFNQPINTICVSEIDEDLIGCDIY